MQLVHELIKTNSNPMPCLFYPVAGKLSLSISDVLADAKNQAHLLTEIDRNYPVGAVIRMTELWCEAASFGMDCTVSENDFPKLGNPIYLSADDLDASVCPAVYNRVTESLIEAVRLAAPSLDKPLIAGVTGPFTLGSVLNGSEDFMVNSMTEDSIVHSFLSKITDFLTSYILEYKAAGASGVILAEPSVSMISPEMTAEFSNIYIQKIINKVQDEHFSVIYHNCGAVNQHLGVLSQLNANGFHFGNEVDLDLAFSSIGDDKLIMGNIDPRLFISGTPEGIQKETARLQTKYCAHGNWMLSTGCDLSPSASLDNIDAFLETAGSH